MSKPLEFSLQGIRGPLKAFVTVSCALSSISTVEAGVSGKHVMSLSNTGLGSDLHLIERISDPFDSEPSLRMMEAIPSTDDETLSQEPVPPEFRTRQSFGEFVFSSLLEKEPESPKPSLLEIQVDRRSSMQMQNTAEAREIEYLNKLVDTVSKPLLIQITDEPVMIQMNSEMLARADAQDYSGPSSVDISGPCSEGYIPFLEERANTLDECWAKCRAYTACTQAHFSSQAGTCYLSHGISTHPESDSREPEGAAPSSVCRSLTAAGVKALNGVGLPPFRILPNNKVFLVSNSPIRKMLASTLAECQSACLESEQCSYGAWLDLDSGSGKMQNECVIGFNISEKCEGLTSKCLPVCGSENCILFNRNENNLVSVKQLTAVPVKTMSSSQSGVQVSSSASCESICRASVSSEDVCVTICLAHERFKCQSHCNSLNCSAVAFTYGGNATEQTCSAYNAAVPFANGNATNGDAPQVLVDVFVPALAAKSPKIEAAGSLVQSTSRAKLVARLSRFLAPSDVRPKFTRFDGSCTTFNEGTMAGVGVGLSKFSAQSLEECWKLCEGFSNNQCSQVHFQSSSKLCTLGDAISITSNPDPVTKCISLNYMPTASSNGLSGMMFVSSVGDMGAQSEGWFSDATEGFKVNSLEDCQAACKQADSGAKDSVCRYAGYVDCSSFHSTLCRGMDGAHPDCATCDQNPNSGICRLSKVPLQSSEAAISSSAPRKRIACLGGKCRWFEKGAIGFSLQVATAAMPAVNYLGAVKAVICDAVSYLPSPVQEKNTNQCYYPVESLWHCQQLCSSANKFNGSGKVSCIGGLYQEIASKRQCKLARSRTVKGKACADGTNCAWFELSGEGQTAGLKQTGLRLADEARRRGVLPFLIGKGQCQQFRALEAAFTKTPSGFQYSPVEDCIRACAYFPQCTSFQLTGSVSGGGACDVMKGNTTDCTFITCALSSAISLPIPTTSNNTLCYSKTPLGTVEDGPAAIDMDGVDPGIPGYTVTNARVRRFGWGQVINKDQLALTSSMEECQSMCRVSDGCVLGTWQPCEAIEGECLASDRPGASRELQSTCNACRNVNLNPTQQNVQFPANMGVCKMASQPMLRTVGCEPEPCYAFEEGSENFYILSMTKSPFLLPEGVIDEALLEFNGDTRTYVKTESLAQCEDYCAASPTCKYGHFTPKSNGYSDCYLTSSEVRIHDGEKYQLKQPYKCDGTCIVFTKLPTKLPPQLTSR